MRSTMKTITNVSIDGRAVDTSQEGLQFTVNSDGLSRVEFNWRDMNTAAARTSYLGSGWETIKERGGTVTMSLSGFTAGHDYMCTPTIFQSKTNAAESDASPGKYDVFMGGGRLQADSANASQVYIDKDIGFIRTPAESGGRLIGGCVLRLGDRDLLIRSYDPQTGLAAVERADINGSSYAPRTTSQGERYSLVTNYLVCDTFVFYARTAPTVTLTANITANGIEVTGTYTQAEGAALQSCKLWGEYASQYFDAYRFTVGGEKQYTQNISAVFPLLASDGASQAPARCDMYCEITTQDGQTAQAKAELRLSCENYLAVTASESTVSVQGLSAGGHVFVWREQNMRQSDHDSGEDIYVMGKLTYIGETDVSAEVSGVTTYTVHDAKAGHRTTYRYIVCAVDSEGGLHYGLSDSVTVKRRTWSLQHLIGTGYKSYRTDGNAWEFSCDVQPSAIETVTGSAVWGTEGRFPKYIHGTDRYEQGSFTALLGSVTEQEVSSSDIASWTEFISQAGPFLLKTENGDVKIVAITGDPSRQYGTALAELGITRVTYSWTEVDDAESAVIR